MAFDRSKFKPASTEAIAQQQKKVDELSPKGSRSNFLKINPGANVFRIFPPHPDSEMFTYPKVVHWLPFMEKNDESKKDEEVRKPLFNARYHAGAPKDLVDSYIDFAFKLFGEEIQDKEELKKKMNPITNWKTGIRAQKTWIFYAKKINGDGTTEFGRLELSNGIKQKLNEISTRTEGDMPVTVDMFSGPDDGKAFQLMYNKNESDNKKKYIPTLLWEKNWKLSDEELESFLELDSLKSLYTESFTRKDFERQIEGLHYFDSKNNYGIFSHDDFLDVVEEISNWLETNYFPPEGGEESTEDTASEGVEAETEEVTQEEAPAPAPAKAVVAPAKSTKPTAGSDRLASIKKNLAEKKK